MSVIQESKWQSKIKKSNKSISKMGIRQQSSNSSEKPIKAMDLGVKRAELSV